MDILIKLKLQQKTIQIGLLIALCVITNSKLVHADEASDCEDDGGPFGLPGLTLPPDEIGEWGDVIDFPVQGTHSIVLHTGKVLFWRHALPPYLFDPDTETYSALATPTTPDGDFFCAGHASMADGRILVAGGTVNTADGIPYSKIFNPVTETWSPVSSMAHPRYYPTLTTLLDGRLLVISGHIDEGPDGIVKIPEIYDPDTDTWTELPDASKNLPLYPFMYATSDGNLFDAGPYNSFSLDYDAVPPTWDLVAEVILPASGAGETSAMYRPDKIIKTGSRNNKDEAIIDRSVVIDLSDATPAWRETAPMNFERRRADSVLLPDGKVMISGGAVATQNNHECAVHAAEIWDPDTEVFTQVASQALSRIYHSTSVLMPDGRILTAGGEGANATGGIKTAEIYSPPYLFKGARPTITSMPTEFEYSADFELITPDAASIVSVVAIRPAAITHNFDHNQRYLPLNFSIGTGKLTVTAPAAEVTPPGYYMIFLENSNGSISEATFIRFDDDTDVDTDLDGVFDSVDNCIDIANPSQENNDGDTEGDACDTDDDNDGLLDIDEVTYNTDPFNPDSDGDNLTDGAEVNLHFTNPALADTDTDGFNDDVEIIAGSDPNDITSIPSPDGDINVDGVVDTRDLILMTQFVLGLATPDASQSNHADVAPLVAGTPSPNGVINAADYLVLTRKIFGLATF